MVILWLTSPRAQHLRHMDIRQLLYHAILARKRAHAYMHVAASLPEAACGGRGGGYTQGGRDAERAVRTRCPVHRPAARVSCEVASGTPPITCTKSHRRWMCGGNRASRSRDTALASRLRRCRSSVWLRTVLRPAMAVAAHGAWGFIVLGSTVSEIHIYRRKQNAHTAACSGTHRTHTNHPMIYCIGPY